MADGMYLCLWFINRFCTAKNCERYEEKAINKWLQSALQRNLLRLQIYTRKEKSISVLYMQMLERRERPQVLICSGSLWHGKKCRQSDLTINVKQQFQHMNCKPIANICIDFNSHNEINTFSSP